MLLLPHAFMTVLVLSDLDFNNLKQVVPSLLNGS